MPWEVLCLYGITHDGTDGLVALAARILGTLLVAPAAAYVTYRAVRDRPALIIGQYGFTDHASITGVGYVTWDAVTGVRQDRVWVAIKLRDQRPNCKSTRLINLMIERLRAAGGQLPPP